MPLIVNEHANGLILAELAGFFPILPQELPRCQCLFLTQKKGSWQRLCAVRFSPRLWK